MTSPYTHQELAPFMAAQLSVGITLSAILFARPMRIVASVLLLMAIFFAVSFPLEADVLTSLGSHLAPDHAKWALHAILALAVSAGVVEALLAQQAWLAIWATLGGSAMWWVAGYVTDSGWELDAAMLAFCGFVLGVHWYLADPGVRTSTSASASTNTGPAFEPRLSFRGDDVVLFTLATGLAAIVATVILGRYTNSGDEWAPTYQAALFAKLRIYGTPPPCPDAFHTFWVFNYMGRMFEQYTPGWAYFMTPFVAAGVPWLAGPFSFGVLAVGVARLSRRAAAGFAAGAAPPSEHDVRAAGVFGAVVVMLANTLLINGASRYSHVFVAAMFAWSLEALLRVADPTLPRNLQWKWGAILGSAAALLVATRPGDGATLGVGLFAYFAYAAVRGRFGWRALVAGTVGFGVWGGLSLVILRLQVGTWFTTGYSLQPLIYPWMKSGWGKPGPGDYRWFFPLATGSYCWWPCSPAVGLAGLAALRGRARRIAFVFLVGAVPFCVLYGMLVFGRGGDLGYGPRYQLPLTVPMAVGTGVVLGRLWTLGRAKITSWGALRAGGPIAIALLAVTVGVVRIAPLIYPLQLRRGPGPQPAPRSDHEGEDPQRGRPRRRRDEQHRPGRSHRELPAGSLPGPRRPHRRRAHPRDARVHARALPEPEDLPRGGRDGDSIGPVLRRAPRAAQLPARATRSGIARAGNAGERAVSAAGATLVQPGAVGLGSRPPSWLRHAPTRFEAAQAHPAQSAAARAFAGA